MKLKIFSDLHYLPKASRPVTILQPFWSSPADNDVSPWSKSIVHYAKISHSLFEITSLEKADFAILPFDWLDVRGNTWTAKINSSVMSLGIQFAEMVKQAKKPLIVFFASDCSHEEIPIKDAFVFRQSLLASQRDPGDFAMNAVYEDLIEHYHENELPIRQKKAKPVVGFNGYAYKTNWKVKLKEIVHKGVVLKNGGTSFSPYKGHSLRMEAIKYLSKSLEIETNFVVRENMAFFEANDLEQKLKFRMEYLRNIIESDYILCCRGRGNFSIRLFETLCCGRIPIFVDTDCVLPYDFKIDWKKYCVWIDSKDLPQIARRVLEFHNNLSPQEFVDLQYECRRLWKEWLSTQGFFTNFWQHFPEKYFKK
ncbi:Exostosin family protein [Fischerella thermalis JSC-11]|uniref:Exostosin family protein n=1 Tax=Fischerella thermalis JSC-11 TaxID=741277 RepID=G6FQY9_9CYAN|nr:exostosin family protein [Fischerella thermalis]EHC18224.1 Exostosin family protein [Fischerella thermalis JSC-11]